ncbi:helicase C-terminal domain-containing protein [Azohydromonas sediminis]|uniref:helicase C-terminal domain-containing protein n=1 Tax=Azohydromonas sediminis TaxID=2259674 RepID=UPI000E65BEE2|nr:helicase C-terminal domain-containing protein [Azohydromonas sediminis]
MPDQVNYSPTYRDELALSRHFVHVLEQKLAGRDSRRRTNVHPLDWCHLGVIGPAKLQPAPVELEAAAVEAEPAPENAAGADIDGRQNGNVVAADASAETEVDDVATADPEAPADEPRAAERNDDREGTRRPPSALGFEALIEPGAEDCIELTLGARFCIFTKHLPTYAEQTGVIDASASAGAPLAEVVERWPLEVADIRLKVPKKGGIFSDDGAVQRLLDDTLAKAFARPDAERLWPGTRPKVSDTDLKTEQAYDAFLSARIQGLQAETWPIFASVEVRATPRPDGKLRVGVYFKNETPETPPLTKGKGLKDAFKVISDVCVDAKVGSGQLHPIEILPVPQDYQYDRRVWAVGHNTSVVANAQTGHIRTAALAVFEQPRIMTRDVIPAKFAQLASAPFETLEAVYRAMGDYAKDWRERVLDNNALGLDAAALSECEGDYAGFADEIRRFACGVAALRADPRLLQAFQGANRVFGKLASGYDAWRLFQLVYIVTQLPALAIRENYVQGEFPEGTAREWKDVLDWGDVLWFRTGGGKTEAYLGLACCAMLYDRLRNKRFGMTAWLRFPLRMLSIQQLQRAMRVVWETEEERKRMLGEQASQSAPFRLGYFVGSTTTPNSLTAEYLSNLTTEESLERVRVVPDCPACGSRGAVKVQADIAAVRFRHICSTCQVELPLDVSDDEVYRHLSTLVVGTIDKMATVGQQPKFGLLWGGAKWKCPTHGYGFGDYCVVYGCKTDKKQRRTLKPYDPAPALHIQDELHLLQEELGAFSGHYETLIRYCEEQVGGLPSKVIAATATIEGFENQVRHLYGVRNARRFPGRGYDRMRSFYAVPDEDTEGQPKTARIFVAFKSPSLSPADASAFCTEILHAEIGRLFANPHIALAIVKDARTAEDIAQLLRYYSTTLNYVGSLAKGSRVRQALEEVASKVRPGARDLNVEYHSSRSSSAEVANVVHRVESPPQWNDESFLDALVATSMISHGVDLERVNLMTMDGVPEETAEYIQASSRSGRRHVGLVVVVLSGFSLRANSIYHRFIEYHQHLDRMVSPVPVNRFAKYAAQRTLPGVALGVIYGVHIAQSGASKLNTRVEVVELIDRLHGGFLDELKAAYSLGRGVYDERLEKALGDVLADQFGRVEMSIRNSTEKFVRDAVRPAPMTSLRDVEAGVPFWPDFCDTRLLTFVQKTKD